VSPVKRLSKRARLVLALILGFALAAAAAGLVLTSRAGRAAAASSSPGQVQTKADLTQMQSALNSGSVPRQAALLAPPVRFMPGSKPVFPPGKTVMILPGTLRSDGQHGTVRARLSDGTAVTLGLYLVQGHWRLYALQAGSAQTSAKITAQPASAQLTADVSSAGQAALAAGTYQGVILVHGFGERASNWDSSGMTERINAIRGVRVLKFDYSQVNTQWVSNPAIGPALADYIHAVARASGRPVIMVGFSMGGLAIRYAATTGARAGDIAMVITIGTPNTGTLVGNGHDLLCGAAGLGFEMAWPGFCTQFQAASAMSVLNPEILSLPKLPPSIPVLHAIAGDQTCYWKIGGALAEFPFFGDVVVPTGSALDKRPGSMNDTYESVVNPVVPGNWSAWHLQLTANPQIQQLVHGYIADYLQAHPVPAAQGQQPLTGHPAGPDGNDPLNFIYGYYDALNAHNYQWAWNAGGSNIAGTSYDSWVAGYIGTKGMYVTGKDLTGGVGQEQPGGSYVVQVSITAYQADGSAQYYAGTYTVGWDGSRWSIVAADIHQTSGPAASAQQLGGDSYWLAGGGQWYVHGALLQISRGPSGLTGTETWNAYGNVVYGTAHLAFTLQPDGSLAGTYTDDTTYTKDPNKDTSAWTGPDPGDPRKGQTITLVPVAPMHAKTVYGSNSPPSWTPGNPNWCQQGLVDPAVCGA
jgi:pimeloyl-ACP methyl ester carboxylesterase